MLVCTGAVAGGGNLQVKYSRTFSYSMWGGSSSFSGQGQDLLQTQPDALSLIHTHTHTHTHTLVKFPCCFNAGKHRAIGATQCTLRVPLPKGPGQAHSGVLPLTWAVGNAGGGEQSGAPLPPQGSGSVLGS